MLGRYDNFPKNIHSITNFTFSTPPRKLQERLIQALHEVNNKVLSSEEINQPALRRCDIHFETGVADSGIFNYLDEKWTIKLQDAIKKEKIQSIDVFFAVRYYRREKDKKTPLRFDYFLMRAIVTDGNLELRIFHERGPRYISPEELGNFVMARINRQAGRKILKMFYQEPLDLGT
jgi:hypothetical protein